jgi:hypothetical protein
MHFLEHVQAFGAAWVAILFPQYKTGSCTLRDREKSVFFNWKRDSRGLSLGKPRGPNGKLKVHYISRNISCDVVPLK